MANAIQLGNGRVGIVGIEREEIGDAIIYCADCADVLPAIQKVDAVVTDPPYGINENSKKVASRRRLAATKDYGYFDWDKNAPSDGLLNEIRSLSEWAIVFGGNYFNLPPTSCWLVWDKMNGASDFADCELAWTNFPKAVRRMQWLWNGMIRQGSEERFHPTQKPLAVIKWAISHCPKSNSIFDPFMGSGTTGVAAAQMGKKFIGVERDKRYFDIACKRIEEAGNQKDIFQSEQIKQVQESLL